MNSPGQHLSRAIPFLGVTFFLLAGLSVEAAAPVVSNVRSAQRAGTQLVDITFDLADVNSTKRWWGQRGIAPILVEMVLVLSNHGKDLLP